MDTHYEKPTFVRTALVAWLTIGGALGCTPVEQGIDGGASRACGSRGLQPCADGEFCKFPDSAACGVADAPGVCTPTPQLCTQIYAAVCACDGKTYANECVANANGASVRDRAACPDEDAGPAEDASAEADTGAAPFCGGIAGIACAAGTFCDFPEATNCGSGDQGGTCQPITEICPQIYKPVCGCDGKTYSNRCTAAGAGISVLREGAC